MPFFLASVSVFETIRVWWVHRGVSVDLSSLRGEHPEMDGFTSFTSFTTMELWSIFPGMIK